ncbi:MAG: FAD-dependent oxidoreductase [Sinobacteraceae bacterium]|nr:FAD-dependent oxidoreductase [Nevskiaceae bacterium]
MSEAEHSLNFTIVGAGQAGAEVAKTLRKRGFEGRIQLYGDEPHLPYRRPPLSKAYLSGDASEDSFCLLNRPQLEKLDIQFHPDVRVEDINRTDKNLTLADGSQQHYDKRALTTGGRSRPLPLEGAQADNVFALRAIADVQRMRPQFTVGKQLVIIGGGFIGLEVAAVASKLGLKVTVVEGLGRVLSRVTSEEMSTFFESTHRNAGVDLRTGARLERFDVAEDGDHVTGVVLADGAQIPADVVLVGIGQLPNIELAQAAGLDIDNGIAVDECAQTSDPDIVAAGDCANFPSALYGRRLRLESVQNAMEQSRSAAAAMMDAREAYAGLPWFWSDQYELKLQMAGLSQGHDEKILRGDPADGKFAIFYLQQGRLIAADTIGRPKDFMAAKKLILARATPDRASLADPDIPLKTLLSS